MRKKNFKGRDNDGYGYFVDQESGVGYAYLDVMFKFMPENPLKKQYKYVVLEDGYGRKKKLLVHEGVAKAFLGPKEKNQVIVHIDGDIHNNCADNLKYVDKSEAKYYNKRVAECRLNGVIIEIYPNIMKAAEETGIEPEEIYLACKENGYVR